MVSLSPALCTQCVFLLPKSLSCYSCVGSWKRCGIDGQPPWHCGCPESVCCIPVLPWCPWEVFFCLDEHVRASLKIPVLSNVYTSSAYGDAVNVQ